MISSVPVLAVLSLIVGLQEPRPTQGVSASNFVGTWVGVQSWAMDNPSPGAKEDQEVTLTLEEVNGKLVGTLTPFFGGSDGVTLTDIRIVDEQLRASAVFGKPRTDDPVPESRNRPRGWKEAVKIAFVFQPDRNKLTGAADVVMNDVKWLKFKYDLGKKRSRY